MKYQNVCIETLAYTLPEEIITSEAIEARLDPLYRRLRLPQGRLELMTGIRARRVWAADTLPGEISVETAAKAIHAAGLDKRHVGALIHASVCRDYLEPATACGVHHRLGLPPECLVYDVSNACLGILNGIVQLANMIELGQIRAGIVVGTESSRQLLETTIDSLNADTSLTRNEIKLAVASLTIGSGSAAVLLTDRKLSRTGNRLLAATARAETSGHALCRSGRDESVAGQMHPLMSTDSERLMHEGIAAGVATFDQFLQETGWERRDIDRTFCHQVGSAHRKLMLESLGLDETIDFATLETLGNTGSVALPITMAFGIQQGHLTKNRSHLVSEAEANSQAGLRVALLGIGSGINSLMLAVDWRCSDLVESEEDARRHDHSVGAAPPLVIASR